MNWPNRLTVLRVLLIPPFLYFAYVDPWWAFGIFVVATLTDTLDGILARRFNLVTSFGKLMDPLADKLLVTSALIVLTDLGTIPAWSVVLILGREFLLTGLRGVAAEQGMVVAASPLGRYKTATQMVALAGLLVFNFAWLHWLYWAAVVLTLISGLEYGFKLRGLFGEPAASDQT